MDTYGEPIASEAATCVHEARRGGVHGAALLLSRYDVLLLDEPTDDLDHDGLERLVAVGMTQLTVL